jgi:hypothetical protein
MINKYIEYINILNTNKYIFYSKVLKDTTLLYNVNEV